jgi:hypothetical protein
MAGRARVGDLSGVIMSASEEISMNGARWTGRPMRGRFTRWLWASAAAALLVGALPAVAGAADYCVAPNTSCGAPNNLQSFHEALDQADNATDADRVFLGAATYTAPTASGYSYNQSSSPVEIIGQGQGQSILTGQAGGSNSVLSLSGGAASSVHDVTIRLPQNAASNFGGLRTENAARRIEVIEDPTQANARNGVVLKGGGTLEDSRVTLDSAHVTTTAVLLDPPGGGTVRRSALSGTYGVWIYEGGTIERSRVTGSVYGVSAWGDATTISHSLIRLTGNSGAGILVQPGASPSIVTADGVTIVAPQSSDGVGAILSTAPNPAESAALSLTNSIIRGGAGPLFANAAGSGHAGLVASYSDYDPSGNVKSGANASITQANVSNVGDAGFADAAAGDYHLLRTSALVDAGDPTTAQGLDLDGNPLVTDGNGDGSARRDLGAFELQPAPAAGGAQPPADGGQPGGTPVTDTVAPLVSDFRAVPSLFAIARTGTPVAARVPRGTRFRYTLNEQARVRIKIRRALHGRRAGGKCVRPTPRLSGAKRCIRYRTIGALSRNGDSGANRIKFSGRLGKRPLRPGRYRAVITATDAAGNHSARRTARFRIAGN